MVNEELDDFRSEISQSFNDQIEGDITGVGAVRILCRYGKPDGLMLRGWLMDRKIRLTCATGRVKAQNHGVIVGGCFAAGFDELFRFDDFAELLIVLGVN